METATTEITVFIALAFCSLLIGNLILLGLFFRVFKPLDEAFREDSGEDEGSMETLAAALEQMETASAALADWSREAAEGMRRLDDECARADNLLQYGLAKLDVSVDKASARLDKETRNVTDTVLDPLHRTATVVQGMVALLELLDLGRDRRESDPRSAA